ncbi:MAG: 50S ribosomal protein P1 [Candidatus Aenigmatarchaeota archaeon]
MEYIYAALLLHSAKKEITEENVKKVLEAAGINVDEARVKSLVESLKGIDIDKVLESATVISAPAIQAQPSQQEAKKEEEEKKKKEEESKKAEEQATAGLAALFGF